MNGIRAVTIALAAGTLMGVAPVEEFSPEQLSLLDPSARMAPLCGGSKQGSSMRAMLAASR